MIGKLDIVQMVVKDWPAALKWYTEVLGLSVLVKEEDHQYCWLGFAEGETKLALVAGKNLESGVPRCAPQIQVDNLDAAIQDLESRGARFEGKIRGGDEGFRIATVMDPEGNRIDFYELTP